MSSPVDQRSHGKPRLPAPDEAKRDSPELKAMKRDMKLLESLRKLRRDRAEIAMRDARAEVAAAQHLVAAERVVVAVKFELYEGAQTAVTSALGSGRHSLDDIQKLLDQVNRSRTAAQHAQGSVSALLREQRNAEGRADDAMRLTQAAAAAHEKVLEWKKSA